MENNFRLRFAPSPTGFLHIGGLRTALFNYLIAKKNSGKLVLRIEDTDKNRKVEGAVKGLIDILNWAGIDFDESPEAGGQFGPYIQSERLELYNKHANQLLADGNAYRCFCSVETLEAMRKIQTEKKLPLRYDGRCRALTPEQIEANLNNNLPFVIRMKIKFIRQNYEFNDLIRGKVQISSKQIDDQVLIKSDGYPTYHLANVIDDHFMEISHVVRGEEWLSSVPKHIQLYEYFGWEVPLFAHIPLLLNADRSKLSKRQNDVAVEDYKSKGYNKQGLLNFICLLGWSPKDNREIFDFKELIDAFELSGINKAGAIVDIKKLDWFSNQHFNKLSLDELDELAKDYYPVYTAAWSLEKRKSALNLIRSNICYLDMLNELLMQLVLKPEMAQKAELDDAESKKIISIFVDAISNLENIDIDSIHLLLKEILDKNDLKSKAVYQTLRLAITGDRHGIDLASLIVFHGKKVLNEYLKNFI